MAFSNLPIAVIVNLLAMVNPGINALRESHFVRHSTSIVNCVGLVLTGISIIVFNPSLYLLRIPVAAFPLILGIAGILMTSRNVRGWDIVGRSLITFLTLLIILLVQFGILIV